MRPEEVIADKMRPYTGAEYRQSLRDGREVYIDGERVADVTTHPAFRNSVRSLSRALRFAARPEDARQTDRADRHRLRRLHVPLFSLSALARGNDREPRRDRRLVAPDLWLDGPHARLQGRVHQHARRQRRILRPLRRKCAALVQARAGDRAVHEPRHRQSAGRPPHAGGKDQGRVRLGRSRDRRRHHRLGRQGGGDLGGDDALQFHGPKLARRRPKTSRCR